jgi:filamentous hemagglutinin family protein
VGLGLLEAFLFAFPTALPAQVVLDGKFGSSGAISGPNFTITAAMGAVRGNNLFQSFSQFDLKAGDVATFTGPASIQNIMSRVTGGSASSIDGTIRSGIQGANFYLINPKGVIFGPNASVDISGSFAASTANYLKLADGARFVASLDADDSALSTAPVSAFGFLGGNPGSISVQQSTIKVPDGKTVSLIGGDISIDGATVQAPQGQINVASVQSAGEVPADLGSLSGAQFAVAFPNQGQINLQNAASVDASGDGGGRIVIRGGRLTVDQSSIQANTTGATDGQGIDVAIQNDLTLVNGGQIMSISTTGQGAGGNINVSAQSITLNGQGAVDENFSPSTQIATSTGDLFAGGGPGRGGDIVIKTGSLDLENSAQISSASFGAGNAGRIDITASSIHMDAQFSTITQISANAQRSDGTGNAGDIVVNTGSLDMLNGATFFAASSGSGTAGQIDIQAHTINLLSAANIIAGTFGSGNGGNVKITADSIYVNGQDPNGGPDFLTGIQAVTTSSDSPAPGGSLHISANTIDLEHMGSFFTTSYGIGAGGNVEVNTGHLTLGSSSTISASGQSTGPAGTLSIRSGSDIQLTGNSAITTSALQSSGGDIHVDAGQNIQVTDSQITAQAGPGGGGNITLTAPSMIYLLNGTLTAQADGDGGNLSIINPVFFIMNNGGLISKSTSANGGNITILSDYFFQSGSTIDASAPFGLPGTVSVSAPEVDLSGSLIGLPSNLLDAENQLRPDCAVRLNGGVSSFIMLGHGGLPIEPGGFVPSETLLPINESK